jgi:hypothetical protein
MITRFQLSFLGGWLVVMIHESTPADTRNLKFTLCTVTHSESDKRKAMGVEKGNPKDKRKGETGNTISICTTFTRKMITKMN